MIRSLPINVLKHDVVYSKHLAKDEYEAAVYDNPVTLKRVRVEVSTKIVKDKDGNDLQLNALMFYDGRYSFPRDIAFNVDDKIEYDGKTYLIQIVGSECDFGKVHHYELGLV